MRKFVAIAGILLLAHTVEEAVQSFWQSDPFSFAIANSIGSSPEVIYWIGQGLLYTFLAFLLFASESRIKTWGYGLLGILLLLEVEHIIVSIQRGIYEAGLVSAIALVLYGLFYLTVLAGIKLERNPL